jgi:2-amino-4-hydroxy-6-hydroxymethyldihydropteridine diphosphokinase
VKVPLPVSESGCTSGGNMRQGFIFGIGTNVDPERNARHIVERLVHRFGRTLVSRFHYTEPVGMDSDRRFINYCAFVETGLDPVACKSACVAIEVELGRDRTDPFRKTRNRTADIDLLAQLLPGPTTLRLEQVADYLVQPLRELTALLALDRAVLGRRDDVHRRPFVQDALGKAPTAVDCDDRAGLVVVGHDRLDSEPNRLGAALLAQQRLRKDALPHIRPVPLLEQDGAGLNYVDLHLGRQPFGEGQRQVLKAGLGGTVGVEQRIGVVGIDVGDVHDVGLPFRAFGQQRREGRVEGERTPHVNGVEAVHLPQGVLDLRCRPLEGGGVVHDRAKAGRGGLHRPYEIFGARLRRKVGRDTKGAATPEGLDPLGLGVEVGDDRILPVEHALGQVEADATTRAGDQDGIGDRRGRGHGVLLEDPVEGEDSRRMPREHA